MIRMILNYQYCHTLANESLTIMISGKDKLDVICNQNPNKEIEQLIAPFLQ